MSVKRADRLAVVLDLADRQVQKASEIYNIALQAWKADEARLEELRSYYAEYEHAFSHGNALRASEIARQRGFLQKLADAIVQQGEVVRHRYEVAENKKALWHKAHLKHGALRDLIQRIRADEERALSKREEKMLDEWFTQSAAGRSARSGGIGQSLPDTAGSGGRVDEEYSEQDRKKVC